MRLIRNCLDMPPVWLAAFVVATWLLPRFGLPGSLALPGWGLIGLGILLMAWAFVEFQRLRTSIIPRRDPSAILTSGPYRFSRNPIYLADAVVLAGAALVMQSLIGLVLVPVFAALIQARFIKGEEARLSAAFPDEAARFFARTRRWL